MASKGDSLYFYFNEQTPEQIPASPPGDASEDDDYAYQNDEQKNREINHELNIHQLLSPVLQIRAQAQREVVRLNNNNNCTINNNENDDNDGANYAAYSAALLSDVNKALDHAASLLRAHQSFLDLIKRHDGWIPLGYFSVLPIELIHHWVSFLDKSDIGTIQLVCSLFHGVSQREALWRHRAYSFFGKDIVLAQKPVSRSWQWFCRAKLYKFAEGQAKNGVGSGLYKVNDVEQLYEGDWENDQPHGQGTLTHVAEGINTQRGGQWQLGKQEGPGYSHYLLTGRSYEGGFANDKYEGEGTFKWPSGMQMRSGFQADQPHGKSCLVWPDARRQEAEFETGALKGKVTSYWPNGQLFTHTPETLKNEVPERLNALSEDPDIWFEMFTLPESVLYDLQLWAPGNDPVAVHNKAPLFQTWLVEHRGQLADEIIPALLRFRQALLIDPLLL